MIDRKQALEDFLKQTHADQGGEADFATFVGHVASDEEEYGHEEAVEYLSLKV